MDVKEGVNIEVKLPRDLNRDEIISLLGLAMAYSNSDVYIGKKDGEGGELVKILEMDDGRVTNMDDIRELSTVPKGNYLVIEVRRGASELVQLYEQGLRNLIDSEIV
jgi:hypothetical protein